MTIHWDCLFGHADRVRERDEQGRAVLTCPNCRHSIPMHSDREIPRGPLHHQAPILGAPKLRAIPQKFNLKVRRSA